MSRYSIALAALLSASTPHLTTADPWSYLSVNIPVALSDMAITTMTISNSPTLTADDGGDNSTVSTNTNGEVTKKIILTGGCVAEKGNEFLGEYFACLELTNKVCDYIL